MPPSLLADPNRFTLDTSGFTWGYFCRQADPVVDQGLVEELDMACIKHDQPSLRLCLHPDPSAALHEMVIVERLDSYFPPHRHRQKGETIQILRGEMAAFLFEDDGRIRKVHQLRAGGTLILRLSKDTYHFYLPLTPSVVYYESKLGPYCAEDNLFASWAPARSDRTAAQAYKAMLRDRLADDGAKANTERP